MITYLRLKDTLGSIKGTFGVWLDGNVPFGTGLEPVVPIIPPDIYDVSWYLSPERKTYVYLLAKVPGHEGVEIHIGNVVIDTKGCILIGQGYGKVEAHKIVDDGIINSGGVFSILQSKVGTKKPWKLQIKEV